MLSSGRLETSSRFSILSIIAVILFTIAVIFAIVVFIYQRSLVKSVNAINAELIAARASFEPSFIKELVRIDNKIESAKSIINKHYIITPIFTVLENETLQGVRFNSFSYSLDSKGQPNIELKGEAKNFQAVALQSDIFSAESKIINPVFSSLDTNDNGGVSFNFKSGLDSKAFLYSGSFAGNGEENDEETETESGGIIITPAP